MVKNSQTPLLDHLGPFLSDLDQFGPKMEKNGFFTKSGQPTEQKSYFDWFRPFLSAPANPVQFFWLKMACTYVPDIDLYVSCWTHTSRGSLRPLKGQKWPKNHFFGHFWVCFVRFRNFSRRPIEKREKCRLRKSCSSFRSPDIIKGPGLILLPVHH